MNRLVLVALTVGTTLGAAGTASAQGFFFGWDPGYREYSGYREFHGPRPYDRERYSYHEPRYYYDEPRYYQPGYGEQGYYAPGRYRSWNGCARGWTVQDGLCKPYRGY